MKIVIPALTLTCALGALLTAGAVHATPTTETSCERQLQYCLMIALTPEPCYWEYEQCVAGGWIVGTDIQHPAGRAVVETRRA